MSTQAIFYDSDGWVRCVENGESKASVHGCEKAVSDTEQHGDLTTRHTVTVEDGEVVGATYHAPPSPTAEEVEAECLREIDRKASRVRARFITEGVGQSAVYLTKYEEAVNYKGASDPVDSDYPYLAKEARRRGMAVSNLADEVIATRNGWTDPAGATIEAERVGGKADVRAASSADDKRAACDAAIATLDGITP